MGKSYGQYNLYQAPSTVRPKPPGGPVPPGSRRVWVRQRNGTPTTITISPTDLVDDLKLAVARKFPNSLASVYDPAELDIKIDVKKKGKDTLLMPDENVWAIVDQHFRGNMTMADALIVDTREREWVKETPERGLSTHNSQFFHPKPKRPEFDSESPKLRFSPANRESPNEMREADRSEERERSSRDRVSLHKRSASHPQLPLNASKNNQAVLLLPKNFSLGEQNPGRQFSLDDSVIAKTVEKEAKNDARELGRKPKKTIDVETDTGRKPSTTTFEKVLPSISVLVVEDNAINQAILGAFLRKHKIRYHIAKNGQEAVDMWKKGGFHLVLMDIQLPVKSGIEATKEIRRLEQINRIGVFAQHRRKAGELTDEEKLDVGLFRSPVIIVALTASSNSSVDKKNALTAGCNDFLTKPVNLVWLQNKITEWGCMQALIDFEGWNFKGDVGTRKEDK